MWQAAPLIRKNYWVDFFMYWYFCDLFQDVQNRGYDAYPAAIQHYSRGIPSDLISIKDTDDYLLQLKSLALNGSAAPHRPAGSHGQPCTWAHIVSCYPPGTGSASHRTDIPSPGDKQKLRYEPNASDPSKRLCTSTRFPIAPASSGLGTGRSAASEGLQGGLSLPAQPRRQWNPMCKNTSRKWVRFTSNYPVTLHEEGMRRESLESCNWERHHSAREELWPFQRHWEHAQYIIMLFCTPLTLKWRITEVQPKFIVKWLLIPQTHRSLTLQYTLQLRH